MSKKQEEKDQTLKEHGRKKDGLWGKHAVSEKDTKKEES